jgi:drug/metabolite transporter (DMT)-like permease
VESSEGPGHEKVPARVYVVLAVGLFSISFSPILVRFASDAPGLAVAVWRTVFAAALVLPFAVVQFARGRAQPVRRRSALAVLGAAVFLSLHFMLWIESLYHTSVASASVLVSTTPIFLGIMGFLILRERLRRTVVLAIGLGVGGAALIAAGDAGSAVEGSSAVGNGLALSASIAAAVYLLIGSIVRKGMDWLTYVAPLYALVAVLVVAVALVRGTPLLGHDPVFYALCFGMAVGPQVLGHGSFNYAIRYISPTLLSLLILLEPVVSSILAFVLFGEMPGVLALAGMILVLASVALAVIPARRS